MKRQKVRRAIMFAMFLLLPVTLYYFSPVIPLQGAASGIVSGSLIVFAFLFLSSLFVVRLFCGWLCPAGGGQELVMLLRKKAVNPRRLRWIKYLVWAPWVTILVLLALKSGGMRRVDFFYQTNHGISVSDLPSLIVLLAVIALFLGLAAAIGRRAACHAVCWMAPFMSIGRAVRNRFGWPSLGLAADSDKCVRCGNCSARCPMSPQVRERVNEGNMETVDCILCGSCIDGCGRGAIHYSFGSDR